MAEFTDFESTFKCNTCKSCFASTEKIKEHYRGEWHILNSKRRANGLFPLKRSEYKALASEHSTKSTASSVVDQPQKKTPISAAKLEPVGEDSQSEDPQVEISEDQKVEVTKEVVVEDTPPQIAANISIFDDKEFETVDDCIQHMATNFGFFLPDVEYLCDLDGLLCYLGEKVKLGGYCLYCQKIFTPGKPCQQHMVSKSHCKLRYEDGVDLEEFEEFYDFSSSYEEAEEEGEEVEVDENGDVVEKGVSVASTGELVLADGRILGHRDFRVYYKQYYRPADTRAPVLAQQREELLRLGGKFGGMKSGFDSQVVEAMEDVQVMSLLVKYHKEVRKGVMVEQRAQMRKDGRNQRLEINSKTAKMRSSEVTTAKIRDYHGMLK